MVKITDPFNTRLGALTGIAKEGADYGSAEDSGQAAWDARCAGHPAPQRHEHEAGVVAERAELPVWVRREARQDQGTRSAESLWAGSVGIGTSSEPSFGICGLAGAHTRSTDKILFGEAARSVTRGRTGQDSPGPGPRQRPSRPHDISIEERSSGYHALGSGGRRLGIVLQSRVAAQRFMNAHRGDPHADELGGQWVKFRVTPVSLPERRQRGWQASQTYDALTCGDREGKLSTEFPRSIPPIEVGSIKCAVGLMEDITAVYFNEDSDEVRARRGEFLADDVCMAVATLSSIYAAANIRLAFPDMDVQLNPPDTSGADFS